MPLQVLSGPWSLGAIIAIVVLVVVVVLAVIGHPLSTFVALVLIGLLVLARLT